MFPPCIQDLVEAEEAPRQDVDDDGTTTYPEHHQQDVLTMSSTLLSDGVPDDTDVKNLSFSIEYCNLVFESWSIQDEASDILSHRHEDLIGALELYQMALQVLPNDAELERASVEVHIGTIQSRIRSHEGALSSYCQGSSPVGTRPFLCSTSSI